jgi:hypothetical protein
MSNTLNTYRESNIIKSQPPLIIDGSEVYGYTIKTDDDHDILNQGSIKHIQQQFDKQQQDNERLANPKSVSSYISDNKTSYYSINNQQSIIKIILIIIFLWLLWDFMWIK